MTMLRKIMFSIIAIECIATIVSVIQKTFIVGDLIDTIIIISLSLVVIFQDMKE